MKTCNAEKGTTHSEFGLKKSLRRNFHLPECVERRQYSTFLLRSLVGSEGLILAIVLHYLRDARSLRRIFGSNREVLTSEPVVKFVASPPKSFEALGL